MKITRFALGIRFAAMAEQPHKEFARKIFEGIFSYDCNTYWDFYTC